MRRNDTAWDALDQLEGRVDEDTVSPFARKLQQRERILREQTAARNKRIRLAREQAGPDDDSAA